MATIALSNKFIASYYLLHQYVSLNAILRKLVTMRAVTSIYNFDFFHRMDLNISDKHTICLYAMYLCLV